MNKQLVPFLAFLVYESLFLVTLIITNFNIIFAGINFLILGLFSFGLISQTKEISFNLKVGMTLVIPFKYFVLGILAFLLPYLDPVSETPMLIFLGFYIFSIVGSPIVLIYLAKKEAKNKT